jgi:hypothetical protein
MLETVDVKTGNPKFTITGKDETKAILTKADDGTWTVRTKRKLVGKGLTEAKAIQAADDTIIPAGVSYQDETISRLIERAVYEPNPRKAERALKVVKGRVTPDQYERIAAAQKALEEIRTAPPDALPPPPPPLGGAPTPEAIPTAPAAPPQPILPPDVQALLDEKFVQHPEFKGMNAQEVRDAIQQQVQLDQLAHQELTAAGYEPTVPEPKGHRQPRTIIDKPKMKPTKVTLSDGREIANPQAEVDRLSKKYYKVDLATADPRAVANDLASRAKEYDINPKGRKDLPLAVDMLDALFNRLPRALATADPFSSYGYSERNILSNIATSTLGTGGKSVDQQVMVNVAKDVFHGIRQNLEDHPSSAMRITEDLGFSKDVGGGIKPHEPVVYDQSGVGIGANTPTRRLAEKLHVDAPAKWFDKKRGFDSGWEYAGKSAGTYVPLLQDLIKEAIPDVATSLAKYAEKRGIALDRDELRRLMFALRNEDTRVFSYDDLETAVHDAAIAKGASEDAATRMGQQANRDWKFKSRQAQLDAIDRTNHIYPTSRRMTNIDNFLRYGTLFHFWSTRTYRFMLEEMIRHPQLYHMWQESHQGLSRMAEEGNYPLAVQMFMRIGESPFGFMLYANPASLYLVTALQPDPQIRPDPNHVTWLGKELLHFKQKTGFGPTPWIDAVLNFAGVYGDALPPNPWPSRTQEWAGAAIDVALTQMGHGHGTPVWDNAMSQIRGWTSGHVGGTHNIPASDQSAYTVDTVGSLVLDNNPELKSRMMQVGPDGYPTTDAMAAKAEFDAIMNDPHNPEYEQADQDAALSKWTTQSLNMFSPITTKAIVESRQHDIDSSHEGKKPGATPTVWQQQAAQIRGMVTETQPSAEIDKAVSEYHDLGTEDQKTLASGWSDIVYGVDDPTKVDPYGAVVIGGQSYAVHDIKMMSTEDRKALADAWVASQGGTQELKDYYALQDKFAKDNPEYGAYDSWKTTASHYNGGGPNAIHEFRMDRAKQNPNFKREMESHRDYLLKQGTDPAVMESELDKWAISPSGYKAAQGIKDNIYSPNPTSTGDQGTVDSIVKSVGSGNAGGQQGNSPTSTADKLKKDIANYKRDAALAVGIMANYGLDASAITSSNPYIVQTMQQVLGNNAPVMTTLMRQYVEWQGFQPKGADTGITAFATYLDKLSQTDVGLSDAALAPWLQASGATSGYQSGSIPITSGAYQYLSRVGG